MDATRTRTIRDAIQQRVRWPQWIGISVGIGVGLVSVISRSLRTVLPGDTRAFLAIGVVLLFLIAILFSKRLTRGVNCPKCAAPMGAFGTYMSDTAQRKKFNFCPYCAVSLDDPMPETSQTAAENVTTPDKLVWK